MYVLDYLIYHLRPYGIVTNSQPLPEKLAISDMIDRFEKSDTDKVEEEVYEAGAKKLETKD